MRVLLPLAALFAAAGCGGPAEEPAPEPVQTQSQEPRRLVAGRLNPAELGPRIIGPQGPEVESTFPGLGTMVSYVACPASVESDSCDPAQLPDGTTYTYVHTITLDEAGAEQARDQWAGATLLRTMMPAPGFSLVIGYDQEQALDALGEDFEIRTEIDDGSLVWRIVKGDGWMPGETLTFFWRSTAPPAGPAEVYQLEADGLEAVATGPFPAQETGDESPAP